MDKWTKWVKWDKTLKQQKKHINGKISHQRGLDSMWSPLHQASLACYAITIVLKL